MAVIFARIMQRHTKTIHLKLYIGILIVTRTPILYITRVVCKITTETVSTYLFFINSHYYIQYKPYIMGFRKKSYGFYESVYLAYKICPFKCSITISFIITLSSLS